MSCSAAAVANSSARAPTSRTSAWRRSASTAVSLPFPARPPVAPAAGLPLTRASWTARNGDGTGRRWSRGRQGRKHTDSARLNDDDSAIGHSEEGFVFAGTYREIVKPSRIVQVIGDGRVMTTTFDDVGGKTKLSLTVEMSRGEEQERQGWTQILENLATHVATVSGRTK